ncbi:MAG: glucose-6-phosphate isomerase [bacterium ADurb.Bin212]|nr:MAG: glucose-6-phosphate isomerase [bacterium ADurb.Bin212]
MSIDLTPRVGLPVTLLDNNKLEFGGGVDLEKMSVRTLADLAVVVKDEKLRLSDDPAYYMYRGVHKIGDEDKLSSNNQRFDLTVIPAGNLGEEFIKTSGHYHPVKEGTTVEYPELYYVVSGQATYIMQKRSTTGEIEDVILARVKAGEAILVPPFYGHVTINELNEPLIMANWVEANFSSVYGDFEEKRGAAYYLMNNELRIKNNAYGDVPEIREAQSNPVCLSELKDLPIYDYSKFIEKLELLANPEKYSADFELNKLFIFN